MFNALHRGERIVLLAVPPGCGKTFLVRELVSELSDSADIVPAKLVCTQVESGDLLRTVIPSFGPQLQTEVLEHQSALLHRLELFPHRLLSQGRRASLIVDEPQSLSVTGLEELRGITNFQINGKSILQFFLVGQERLRAKLLLPFADDVLQ